MTTIEIKSAPPGATDGSDGPPTPRPTPMEWVRRRRAARQDKAADAVRARAMTRIARLGPGWHLIPADELGYGARDALVAIGPGGVFAVTVKSQGRAGVRVSGDVVQIGGARLPYLAQARKFGEEFEEALSRAAGTRVPTIPVLALTGSGPITYFGAPRGAVIMPYRELASMFGSYGTRIAPRTVEKLASIVRRPPAASGQRSAPRIPAPRGASPSRVADKSTGRR